jgi:hypothetical protein
VGPSPAKPQLWSRHVATPDGWTFVIPNTTDTTSYGYLYNKDITPLETAKTNFNELFPEASESYSGHFEHAQEVVNLSFESYMAKTPLRIDSNGRKIILNGNRVAFLEPMESTAIEFYLDVAKFTFGWVVNQDSDQINNIIFEMNRHMHEIHTFILWHYTKGSVYDTPFWRTAQAVTTNIFEQPNENFQQIFNTAKSVDSIACRESSLTYGHWALYSIKQWYDGYIK